MLNNRPLNNQWVTEEIKKEIKKIPEENESGSTMVQNLQDAAKQFSETSLHWYKPTLGNKKNLKQPNLISKGTRKRTNENSRLVEENK